MLLIVSLGMKSFASFKPPWIFRNHLKLIFNILKRKYFFPAVFSEEEKDGVQCTAQLWDSGHQV